MKRLVLILSIVSMAFMANAQGNEPTVKNEKVVINKAMIEKFNNAELPEGYLDFASLYANYSYSDIKLITSEYIAGNLELNESNIENFLSNSKIELNDYSSIKENKTLGQLVSTEEK